MKKTIALLLAGFAAGFLFAWIALGRYQLTQVGGGNVAAYRIDRFTGEVYYISNTRHGLAMPAFFNEATSPR